MQRSVTVFTNAEVVCVDGTDRVEAVVVRRIGTGQLIGVNAAAIQVLGAPSESSSVRDNRQGQSDRPLLHDDSAVQHVHTAGERDVS